MREPRLLTSPQGALRLGTRVMIGGKACFLQGTALPTTPNTHSPSLLYLVSEQLCRVRRHIRPEMESLCVPFRPPGPACTVLPVGDPKTACRGWRWVQPIAGISGTKQSYGCPGGGLLPAEGRLPFSQAPSRQAPDQKPNTLVILTALWGQLTLGVRHSRGKKGI